MPGINRFITHRFRGFNSVLLFICLVLKVDFIAGQEEEPYYLQPGDVNFESPFEKFNLPVSNFSNYSKILYQDSKGFIWMVYEGYLYKFDGYELTEFLKTPIGPLDLNAHFISTMAEDEFGYLWIGCLYQEGLYRYDLRKETFQRFPRDKDGPLDISEANISAICPDNNGRVWIGTNGYGGKGLYMYDYRTDSIRAFRHGPDDPSSLPDDHIVAMCTDPFQNVWFTCFAGPIGGLFHFNPGIGKFTEFRLEVPAQDPLKIFTRYLRTDNNGNLWFCINYWFNPPYSEYSFLFRISDSLDDLEITSSDSIALFRDYKSFPSVKDCNLFTFDHNGNLWLETEKRGVMRFNPISEEAECFKPYGETEWNNSEIFNVICDASGAIWYSNNDDIKRYVPGKVKFTSYDQRYFQLPGANNLTVNSIYEDSDGIIWMGANRSLIRTDPASGSISQFIPPLEPWQKNDPGNELNVILPGRPGDLYIAGSSCFYIFNKDTKQFDQIIHPFSPSNMFGGVPSYSMFQDKNGLIWIATGPDFLKVDLINMTSGFVYQDTVTNLITFGNTYDMLEDLDGYFWLGTDYGLIRYDPETKTSIKIFHDPYKPDGLAAPRINSLLQDRGGNFWVGYTDNGLSFLDVRFVRKPDLHPDSLRFRHYSIQDGLPDLHIGDLAEDRSGNIWISTSRGLARLDPVSGKITVFDCDDGIQINPFLSHFFMNPETGRIFIGGKNGMISFDPENIPLITYAPAVVITDFLLHNKPVHVADTSILKQSITCTDHLDLTYRDNFLQFTFAALDFTDPEKNNYMYYMDGVDRDTVDAGPTRTAEYRNLKPGRYTFWVTGSNSDGIWNPEGTSLSIRIHPPWYQSTAAQSGYILTLALLILGYIRLRTRKLRKEKIMLEGVVAERTAELREKHRQILELEQLKTRFFTDVSHEIRTPLSLITGPLDNLIKQEHPDPKTNTWLAMIRRNSRRLLQLVNQLLDISRLDAGHMKLILEESDVMKYLLMLVKDYSSLAESRKIHYIIDIPDTELVTWYDREKVGKITANLLSNAFKFTPEHGTVAFRAKILKGLTDGPCNKLRIFVADSGPGIPLKERNKIFERFYRAEGDLYEDAGGTGIGLSLTKELTGLMHGEVVIKSLEGEGAVFIVTLPLGREHLKNEEYILKENDIKTAGEDLPGTDKKTLVTIEDKPDKVIEVLIVEDNSDLRTFIRENLTDIYTVYEAGDGNTGLQQAQSHIPDVIISDVMMPGIDGMELCRQLKNDERTSHIPIIMLTAKATGRDKITGLETGVDDYIYKPFSMDELRVRIKNLLEQRERLRKKYSGMIGLDWGKMAVTTLEDQFLKKVTGIIAENMQDFGFDVGVLQEKMSISREHLYRKIKALTGDSPSDLIRIMRLKTAASLIEKGNDNITMIAMSTGFTNPSHFARRFREYYGMTPKEYQKEYSGKNP